ncbi:sodium-dependent transporter [Lysinibacillus sp. NPDC097162]|uniref:sodium-dependent transporter n=1 Tax=Lysinibacillus sp. NPDC097162 TaxID=3364140 RepID=UPI0037FB044C
MAGTIGGSVFILCTFFIGLPVLIADFMIDRHGQKDAVTSFKEQAPGKSWFLIGWGGIIIACLILSFYSVVGGWILSSLGRSLTFQLSSNGSEGNYADLFSNIISSPIEAILVQGLFLLLTVAIVSGGIKGGIEKASTWMMPLLFIFFIVLVIRSLTLDGAMDGVNAKTFLKALGQAFFSLSVGIAVMITYASYLPKTEKIGNSAINVASIIVLFRYLQV